MNYPNHETRRAYMVRTPYYKRIQKLSFFHPDKIEHYKSTREKGNEIYKENFDLFQRQYVDSMSKHESNMMELLKSKGMAKEEIDSYMDVWAEANMWPAPKDRSVKKNLKKLNKKYHI